MAIHDTRDTLLEVGLTGGIASGKSTVDRFLDLCGATIIDADTLVHDLLREGTGETARIARRFGAGVLSPDGSVNRKILAGIVFQDEEARQDLNAILHPAVRREEKKQKQEIRGKGGGIVVTDAALLVETGRYKDYDRLVVIFCDPSLQLARLLAREPGMTGEEARARISAQIEPQGRLALADYVIDTSGTMAETERRTHEVYVHLVEDLEFRHNGEALPAR